MKCVDGIWGGPIEGNSIERMEVSVKCTKCDKGDALYCKRCEWISIKDRLPEVDESVLVVAKQCNNSYHEVLVGRLEDKDKLWWQNTVDSDGIDVTHWMHLPSKPKEGQ